MHTMQDRFWHTRQPKDTQTTMMMMKRHDGNRSASKVTGQKTQSAECEKHVDRTSIWKISLKVPVMKFAMPERPIFSQPTLPFLAAMDGNG